MSTTKSFWKLELELREGAMEALTYLAKNRKTTPPKLVAQAIDEFLARNDADIHDSSLSTQLTTMARKDGVDRATLAADLRNLSEENFRQKSGSAAYSKTIATLRNYVQSSGK